MDKPILFSGPMVRTILAGDKTQTRRVIKPQPPEGYTLHEYIHDPTLSARWHSSDGQELGMWTKYLKYDVGMHLWVRETFFDHGKGDLDADNIDVETRVEYKATPWDRLDDDAGPWTPSIFMPRLYSRITLEALSVRVERLQSISDQSLFAEGVRFMLHEGQPYEYGPGGVRDAFSAYWDSINAKRGYSWSTNPWVVVLEFKRV